MNFISPVVVCVFVFFVSVSNAASLLEAASAAVSTVTAETIVTGSSNGVDNSTATDSPASPSHASLSTNAMTTNGGGDQSSAAATTKPTTSPIPTIGPTVGPTTKKPGRQFDGASFGGGFVLAMGLVLIIFVMYCCYTRRRQRQSGYSSY